MTLLAGLGLAFANVPANVPAQRTDVNATLLLTACRVAYERGAKLAALWASDDRDRDRGYTLRVALRDATGLTILEHTLPDERARYPDLSPFFPAANRMQRAAFDLLGVAADADDTRPWLWQAAWPIDRFPLRRDFDPSSNWEPGEEDYAFVRVEGDGVHEIPVGPVHAGIIEPGHFRFPVVGEQVLRLEERLAYVHKGIEKRFQSLSIEDGCRLAGRVSGDSTVAYGLAFAHAVEALAGIEVPHRAVWLRALCLERERIANHLGDLGYLGNDGGFAFGLAQFSRLREDMLRLNLRLFGHRLLMDAVLPGGLARDLSPDGGTELIDQCEAIGREVAALRDIYDEHAGLQDRFRSCGQVLPELADQFGIVGFAGRASGARQDVRCEFPSPPYERLGVRMQHGLEGDVAARVNVRFDEIFESLRLIREMLVSLPEGDTRTTLADLPAQRVGIGFVEGWRGPVLLALETGSGNVIRRCHPHDPSWQNWPVLEHAVIGNIVPDFPLINKSFNLSYSGHDL